MSATETMSMSQPPHTHNQREIIDVDAFEEDRTDGVVFQGYRSLRPASVAAFREEGVAFMGFSTRTRATGRSHTSGAQAGPSSSTRSSEDVIVLDSDNDDEPSPSGSGSVARGRLVSPPPPPAQRGHTPAVPPLPRHLVAQASLPMRPMRRSYQVNVPPPPTPPIIRPSQHPLPFESRMASLPRLPPRNSSSPALSPAPRSHHQPAMGFGGALIALNRQNALEEENRREREARHSFNLASLPTFSEMFRRLSGQGSGNTEPGGADSGQRRWSRLWPFNLGVEDDVEPNLDFSPFSDDDTWFHLPETVDFSRKKAVEKVVHWKPEYTHPDKTGAGFSFDFSPADTAFSCSSGSTSPVIVLDEDEPGPSNAASSSASASAVETTLVCARCLDPLVLAAPDGALEEDRKRCRVWALRCGHMLDGKCVAELIAPPPPPTPAPEVPAEEEYIGKGKGKARALPEVVFESSANGTYRHTDLPVTSSTADRKGKRKALEPLQPESPPKRPALAEASAQDTAQDTSIRSRLRSHTRAAAAEVTPGAHGGGSAAHIIGPLDMHPPAMSGPRVGSMSRRRRRGPSGLYSLVPEIELPTPSRTKGKGKARAKAEPKVTIEAEHEWRCPVAGCGRVHYSIRIEGVWKNDEGRGGIALFV
ncbi:hypothetical protein C8Q74DRAFT_1366576 [Fomes fomentarius]|nr:hypothetical protein C8Q74DRAFT_1366576 [Fomes fomentarius]